MRALPDTFTRASYIEQFRTAMVARGIRPPDILLDDGNLHRCDVEGKNGKEDASYLLHGDGIPAGGFQNWRDGQGWQNWQADIGRALTPEEKSENRQKIESARRAFEAEVAERHKMAREQALLIWTEAYPCTGHEYLAKKGIQANGAMSIKAYKVREICPTLSLDLVDDDLLVIPMREGNVVHSLQFIDAKGTKRPLTGGRKQGRYFAIGKPDKVLCIAEGFATAASIHESTGYAVAVAFDAGNLLPVAKALRQQYPDLTLVLCADDDYQKNPNVGMTKASEAAKTVSGIVAIPDFGENRPDSATDFNDLHQAQGMDVVKRCIDVAIQSVTTPRGDVCLADAGASWPDPEPLPNDLPPVAPFDPELLPKALRGWVMDIAYRMQCPPDFSAVGAMVAVSSLIGARAVVAPKERDDWRVVPNLWGLCVGRSGVMKSPALAEVLKPLHRMEATEREQWKMEYDAWELDCKVAELASADREKKARGLASKDPAAARALLAPVNTADKPTARRYETNDVLVEKLADLLTVNPWGLLVYRDELHSLLAGMDRQGQEGSRGFYLMGYDGNQGYAVDRIGRGESYVKRVCLAMLGGIQPGKLQRYVRDAVVGGAGDDGLLQRFGMAVWPDVNREFIHVDQFPDTLSKQAAWAVFERLNKLQAASDTDPQEWRFTPEAQEIYREWVVPFETEIRGDELHPALVSHLSKYRKLIPALALIFAIVDTPDSANVIHERELLRALEWADYLRTHAGVREQ